MKNSVLLIMLWLASGLCPANSPWERAGRHYGIDPLLLYAIATKESGRAACFKLQTPWPRALNVRGRTRCYRTRAEFVRAYLGYRRQGIENIDVGLMQFNMKWNGRLLAREYDILYPARNIFLGAEVLKTCMRRRRQLWPAVGCYHSSARWRAARYASEVRAIYAGFRRQRGAQ